MLGPHLDKHYREKHIMKGGENKMIPSNAYQYEEIEKILLTRFTGKTASEISFLMDKKRTSTAIDSVLRKFDAFLNGEEDVYISSILKDHFTRYTKEHANEIPKKSAPVEETQEAEEKEEESEESSENFKPLQKWYKEGGEIIMAYVKAEVEAETAKVLAKKDEEIKTLMKELEELREWKAGVKKLLSA